MNKIIITLFLLFYSQLTIAQYQIGLIPRISPDKACYQKIGLTEIEIKYGSPSVKNRNLWGELVPFDEVWRAGANKATTIEFSTNVRIEDKALAQGKYALFVIPKQNNKWEIVFNEIHDQWGAFDYDDSQDALKIEVIPSINNNFHEQLSYAISNYGFQFGTIQLNWGELALAFEVNTEYNSQFEKQVEDRIEKVSKNTQWVVYLQGAEHLLNINSNLVLAEEWLEKSEKLYKETKAEEWNKRFYPQSYIESHLYWTKAKLLAQNKDYHSALSYASKMQNTDTKSLFYKKKNDLEKIDQTIKEWNKH